MDSFIKIQPSVGSAVCHDQFNRLFAFFCRGLCMDVSVPISSADYGAYAGRIIAVHKIVFNQHMGCRDCDRAQLVEPENRCPELPVTFQHQHDTVSLPNANGTEIVCCLTGQTPHIAKGEFTFILCMIQMYHSNLIRAFLGKSVYGIISKIVFFQIGKTNILKQSVFIFRALDKGGDYWIFRKLMQRCCFKFCRSGFFSHIISAVTVVHNQCKKFAVSVYCNHAMGKTGVIIYGIAFMENFCFAVNFHLQRASQHKVKFLPCMAAGTDFCRLLFFAVFRCHIERFGDFVLEHGCKVIIMKSLPAGNRKTVTGTVYIIFGQGGAGAFQDIGGVGAQTLCAFIDECESKIGFTCFQCAIGFQSGVGAGCHFFFCNLAAFPQRTDAPCNITDCSVHVVFHNVILSKTENILRWKGGGQKKKPVSF